MTFDSPVEKLLYTRKETAFALGTSLRTVTYMLANKRITPRKFGGRVMIPVSEVRRISRMDHTKEQLRGTHGSTEEGSEN